MEVLVTGGDTDLGRTIAETFRDDGHRVVITGARRDELEIAAKELDVDAVTCDCTDPASLADAMPLLPHHLDTIVNVPAAVAVTVGASGVSGTEFPPVGPNRVRPCWFTPFT